MEKNVTKYYYCLIIFLYIYNKEVSHYKKIMNGKNLSLIKENFVPRTIKDEFRDRIYFVFDLAVSNNLRWKAFSSQS